jgi:hypothetical protein
MKEVLHNKYVLYGVFMIALLDFLYLGYVNDMNSVYIFVLMVILLTFFNKNMIIVLGIALLVTNVLKLNHIHILKEGFNDDDDDKDNNKNGDKNGDNKNGEKNGEKNDDKNGDNKDGDDKNGDKITKEEFGQDKEVVYTSVEDQNIDDDEKMLLAHEKILDRMNKYKPLLDTLRGLTKNIAMVRGITDSVSELKEDE